MAARTRTGRRSPNENGSDRSSTVRSSSRQTVRERRDQRRSQVETPRKSGSSRSGSASYAREPRKAALRKPLSVPTRPHDPPILIRRTVERGDMAGLPIRERKVEHPRRRFDIALGASHAEVRLPSLPAVNFSWRIASGILVILMLAAAYMLVSSPVFQIEIVEVVGLKRLTMDDIGLIQGLYAEPVYAVDTAEVERFLLTAFPEFSSVKVEVGLPARALVTVVERQPALIWIKDGEEIWVDADGIAFPPRGDAGLLLRLEGDHLPISTADPAADELPGVKEAAPEQAGLSDFQEPVPVIDPLAIPRLQSLGKYVPEGTPLVFSHQDGFGWEDPQGWQVFFGSRLKDIDQKLVVYQALLERLSEDGIRPAYISVEFLHAPFYRLER